MPHSLRSQWVPWTVHLWVICSILGGWQFAEAKPRIALFTTGGTIQSKGDDRLTLFEYRAGRVPPDELLADLPELKDIADIEVHEISNVGSNQMDTQKLLALAKGINGELAREEISGAVVTHGTGTLEETAYFLHLTVKSSKPVVVVGAMRPFTAISRDGPFNLYNAVRTAGTPQANGMGVMVVLNDTIHSARFVTKGHTYHVETFVSRELGPLGYVDSDQVVFYRKPLTRHTSQSEFDISDSDSLPQVDIVYGYQEASAAPIDALVEDGSKGIIYADGSPAYANAFLAAQAKGIVIVQSDRKGAGRVVLSDRSAAKGIVTADNLNAQKARVLLRLALTKTTDPRIIQRIFNEY
ncbi:MAG: asparaginase [Verrucomicrobia bacterium]|nr:asparaginase [Verrucomicrobiota bacterium]